MRSLLRPRKTRAQDDRLKNSFDGIFRIDPHAALQHQMGMKTKIRPAMAGRYMN